MDRRDFFNAGFKNVSSAALKEVEDQVSKRASRWIRPPYALDELEFLLTCTRCDKCIEACPHQVIFSLAPRLGAQVVGTPAMDLLNKGCHLCDDWPCVAACEPKALKLPEVSEQNELELPHLAVAEINTDTCLPYNGPECGACAASCPIPDTLQWEGSLPSIDTEKCTGCGLCREDCIVDPKAIMIKTLKQNN